MAAPNRTEPTPAPADAAAAPAAAAAAAPSTGGLKAWLPLILTVVLMPALAYAMTSFVLLPHLQKGLGMTSAPAEHEASTKKSKGSNAAAAKKERVTLSKLLVNVAGTMGQRYLLVSLSVEGSGEGFADKMKEADAPLRAMACSTLALKTLADLDKPTARPLITTELISGFNNILGEPMIQQIYLTEFAIQ